MECGERDDEQRKKQPHKDEPLSIRRERSDLDHCVPYDCDDYHAKYIPYNKADPHKDSHWISSVLVKATLASNLLFPDFIN